MKYILTFVLFFFCLVGLTAQGIKNVINTIPDDVVFGLSAEQKAQLAAEPYDDTITVDNALNGEIKRLNISKDYINLQTSDVGTTQIKILPLVNDSQILCVIKTVCSNACDSRIQFYTMDWKLLPGQDMFPQRTFEWFIKADADRQSEEYKDALKAVDMNPVMFALSPTDYSLQADSEIGNYLSAEDYTSLECFLSEKPKIFVWDKISFKEKR